MRGEMFGARAVKAAMEETTDDLFDRVGDFLRDQGLGPDPANYAFAHSVVTDPDGDLARAVRGLTDGGVRLSRRDIEALGGHAAAGVGTEPPKGAAPADTAHAAADGLVAQTQMQVEGFTDMMQTMRAETEGFGRDLAASAAAMRRADRLSADDVVRLTTAMVARVRAAETRLDAATHEASELRTKLEEARDNARRDPLTGLPNRRAFEEAHAALDGAPCCLAVCDIDHFKAVNDRFGHAVGDRVLKAIADALSQACEGQVVARYGGEEFAVLFRGIDRATALATLDDARRTVAAKRYRLRESDEPLGEVTFSAGLTCGIGGESLGAVFGRADALLYAAKHAGRNRLEIG